MAHRPPTLIGQWRWVRLDFIFTISDHVYAPGGDSTVILQLNSDSTYAILVNGKTGYSNSFGLTTYAYPAGIDTQLTINNPVSYSFFSNNSFPLSGGQELLISQDTLRLTQYSGNPAGTGTIFSFIPYP